jgi:hypothetical protein
MKGGRDCQVFECINSISSELIVRTEEAKLTNSFRFTDFVDSGFVSIVGTDGINLHDSPECIRRQSFHRTQEIPCGSNSF